MLCSGELKARAEKHLGIIIDSNLDFREHADSKVKKANQMVGLIKRSFSHVDKKYVSKSL